MTDQSTNCPTESTIYYSQIVLPIGGSVSVLCYLYLFYMYYIINSPILKRHPTTLAINKCILEFIFVQQFIWLPFLSNDVLFIPGTCYATPLAAVLSFITQFSLLGGELWFLIISYDLRLAYTNPFTSFKQNQRKFFIFSYGIALVTSFSLMGWGNSVYGLAAEGIMWIQDSRSQLTDLHSKSLQINVSKGVLFYMWMVVIYVYCVWAIWQLSVRMKRGFAETLNVRISIMKRAQVYVIGYTIFWGILLSVELAAYELQPSSPYTQVLMTFVAYFFSFRGVWSLAVILYTNKSEITWTSILPFKQRNQKTMVENVVAEGLTLKPHLNTALRAEILFFTTQGIIFACHESERHVGLSNTKHKNINTTKSSDANSNANGGARETQGTRAGTAESSMNETKNDDVMFTYSDIRISQIGGDLENSKSGVNSFGISNSHVRNSLRGSVRGSMHAGLFGSGRIDMETMGEIARLTEIQRKIVEKSRMNETNYEAEEMGLLDNFYGNSVGIDGTGASMGKLLPRDSYAIKSPLVRDGAVNTSGKSFPRTSKFENNDLTVLVTSSFMTLHLDAPIVNRPDECGDGRISENSSTADTLKWRDTMDIEFSASNIVSQNLASTVAKEGSISPYWYYIPFLGQRMKSKTQSHINKNDSSSSQSITSKSSHHRSDSISSSQSATLAGAFRRTISHIRVNAEKVFLNTDYDEFKFKDYNPVIFNKIRAMAGINHTEYASAFLTTTRESFSEGRSGAFMFYSSDQKYIVKSTVKSEIMALRRILPKYFSFLKGNPYSLITRFVGAHRITMYGQNLHFVVMLNVFPTSEMSERYDLKGSWVNRHRTIAQRYFGHTRHFKDIDDSSPLFFDNDIQQKILLMPSVANALADQVRKDVVFLREQGLMDYSLLVGIKRAKFEVLKQPEDDSRKSDLNLRSSPSGNRPSTASFSSLNENPFNCDVDGGMRAAVVEGPGTYYIGIIDILQEWNFSKKLERFGKKYLLGKDGNGLSAISPDYYAARFYDRCVVELFDGLENTQSYFMPRRRLFRSHLSNISTNASLTHGGADRQRDGKSGGGGVHGSKSSSNLVQNSTSNSLAPEESPRLSRNDKNLMSMQESDEGSVTTHIEKERGTVRLLSSQDS